MLLSSLLGDRAQRLSSISFAVFQTDSILLPDVVRGMRQLDLFQGEANAVIVPTTVGDFALPEPLATLDGIATLRRAVEASLETGRSSEMFSTRLRVELKPNVEADHLGEVLALSTDFYDQVRELNAQGRNGIWARIVEQALAPIFIEPVDLVVGNPPWISWKDLPQGWKDRSEPTWRLWGLWQQSRGGRTVPLSDISTLLLARCVATYAPTGVIGLVLPQHVLIADPGGRAIRACDLRSSHVSMNDQEASVQFCPLAVDDFSNLNPFSPDASNLPIALYLRAGSIPSFPYPHTKWNRRTSRSRLIPSSPWSVVGRTLVPTTFDAGPIDEHDRGGPWAKANREGALRLLSQQEPTFYSWGRGFETRGLDGVFFCSILTPRPTGVNQLIRIRNHPEMGDNTRDMPEREAEIESQLVWPLIKGENLHRWFIEDSQLYCILPHDPNDFTHVYSRDELAGHVAPRLYDYLEHYLEALGRRSMYRGRADTERPWALQGPLVHLSSQQHLVVTRKIAGGAMPAAAVASPRFRAELGRSTVDLPYNTTNLIFTEDEEEAHYLAAWINSAPAQEQIGRFAASTGITPRVLQYLPIDRFSADNAVHRRLAQLGKAAHNVAPFNPSELAQIEAEVAAVVMQAAR